jgi:hypothetical protein
LNGEERDDDEDSLDKKEFDFTEYTAKYGIGIDLRLIENRFVVTRVDKDSTAENSRIKNRIRHEKIKMYRWSNSQENSKLITRTFAMSKDICPRRLWSSCLTAKRKALFPSFI